MDIRELTPRYYVSPQIDPADMDALKARGITRILCNRPDAEVPPSHSAAAIRTAAEAAGLSFAEQPLTHQTMVPENIAENRAKGAATDDVVLAYCASGTRSTIAWALGNAGELPVDEIISSASKAGYDIENLRPALAQPFT
ncbi:TIGR01244 family protein [Sulfitobacter brevis]|uniref:TIGR01244 family protein n=1 Tax=Sulfitobacter brevis TaxID=74348 RepID=A0A1I1ZI76_9RHOB|nr:TIGR01244 family sulfur transferase [Sulfitobacter brevis]SFE31292.1 TIGR01244 family protein [Sulfitobacter brevis]